MGTRGRVIAEFHSALHAALIEIPDGLAATLADDVGVLQLVQDHRIPVSFSTPINDCSAGIDLATAVPALPESISCVDPDPQNANGVCTDNWGLDRLDGLTVKRDGVYNPPHTGQGVHIFLIDTGLYAQNQEFAGRVGLGFDATKTDGLTNDCGAWSHGTHVAGIAGGTRFGVAKAATLHSVRIATCPLALQLSSIIAAFDWVAQAHGTTVSGPAVASMSVNSTSTDFTDPSSMLNTAVSGTIAAGVLVIESAGNNLGDACLHTLHAPGVLIVGGSDEFDTPWERTPGDPNFAGWCTSGGDCGSNTGACVSLFAPAAHIVSSWYGMTADPRNMCRLSGTSMAAPHAAGAAALYLQAHPTATPAEVRQGLIDQTRAVLTELPAGSPNRLLSLVAGEPGASVSPSAVSFGTQPVSTTSAARDIQVASTGTLPLHVGSVTVTGTNAADFQITANGCTADVAVGQHCTISVTCTPGSTGQRNATLTLATNAPSAASVPVGLSGEGTALATLSVMVVGGGAVTSAPAGIACGATCSAAFSTGTSVLVSAQAAAGSRFVGWSGAGLCAGTSGCIVVLTANQQVTATFTLVEVGDAGQGTVLDAGGLSDAGLKSSDAGVKSDAGVFADGGLAIDPGVVGQCGCASSGSGAFVIFGLMTAIAVRRRRTVRGLNGPAEPPRV